MHNYVFSTQLNDLVQKVENDKSGQKGVIQNSRNLRGLMKTDDKNDKKVSSKIVNNNRYLGVLFLNFYHILQ